MSQNVQVLYHRGAAQVKQVLALPTIAGAGPLPTADVRQIVFDRYTFTQFRPASRGELALAQLLQQSFIAVNADTAPGWAGRAALAQRAGRTLLGGKVHHPTRFKSQREAVGTADALRLPIQGEGGLGETRHPLARARLCSR